MNYSKITVALFFSLSLCITGAFAQGRGTERADRADRLNSAKIGYISTRLNLTPKQAETFWPLFNEYDGKRKAIRQQMRTMRLNGDSLTDKQSLDRARSFLSLRESEVRLEQDYIDKFSKVLTGKQVLAVASMDREFVKMLLKRRGGGPGQYGRSTDDSDLDD